MQDYSIGKKIQEIREHLGISQEQMAADLLVTRQAVSQWETGATYPSLDTLKLLCEKYDVEVDFILCLGEYKKQRDYELLCEKTKEFTAPYESRYNTDRTAFLVAGINNINKYWFFEFAGNEDELLNIMAAVFYRTYRDVKLKTPESHEVLAAYKTQKDLEDELKYYLGKMELPDMDVPEYQECEKGIDGQMKTDISRIDTYFNSCTHSCIYGLSYNEKPDDPDRRLYSLTSTGMTGDATYFAPLLGYLLNLITWLVDKKNQKNGMQEPCDGNNILKCLVERANDLVPGRHGEFLVHKANSDSAQD